MVAWRDWAARELSPLATGCDASMAPPGAGSVAVLEKDEMLPFMPARMAVAPPLNVGLLLPPEPPLPPVPPPLGFPSVVRSGVGTPVGESELHPIHPRQRTERVKTVVHRLEKIAAMIVSGGSPEPE